MRHNDPPRVIALLVFAAMLIVYQADPTFLFYSDTQVNTFAAINAVERSELLFTPETAPWALEWEVLGPKGVAPVEVVEFDELVESLRRSGALRVSGETYLVRKTVWPERYVNTFGWGVSWSSIPVLALLEPWLSNPETRYAWMWYGAKLAGSVFVAGSAGFVFLAAARFTSIPLAILLAFAYGLGTSVWSTSSQTLWQHAPSEFFLSIGTYALLRWKDGWKFVALCAAAYAWATWCRQTSAIAVLAAGGYFLVVDRRVLVVYVLSGLPFAAGMFGLNAWCYGSPWHFGELLVPNLATDTTGKPAMWQTPLWIGLPGMLFSPSRGMFIYSPFLAFAGWGAWECWRSSSLRDLRPLTVAIAALWGVHAVYFDWWGGFSYGYRQIVDSTTMLVVLIAPIAAKIFARPVLAVVFPLLVAWSIAVQAVGAWSFDIYGWNNRAAVVVGEGSDQSILRYLEFGDSQNWKPAPGSTEQLVYLSIDNPANRHRLWSLSDNQIAYYFWNYRAARDVRRRAGDHFCRPVSTRRAETARHLADALLTVGLVEESEQARRHGQQFR